MKTPDSTRSAADAAITKARKEAKSLLTCLTHIEDGFDHEVRQHLPKARALLAEHLHEFNAYFNVLTTA